MRLPSVFAALALAPVLALAGCIAPQAPPEDETTAAAPPATRIDGMTVESEEKQDKSVDCAGGLLVLPSTCAERDLLVSGRIGVEELPVSLHALNGPVTLTSSGEDDAWTFHAVVRVRGTSQDDAKAALDTAWKWTHEDAGKHVLMAGPKQDGAIPLPGLGTSVVMARYEVSLPSWVLVDLKAKTSNGPLTATGLQASSVVLDTSNGPVTFEGRAADVDLDTSNGPVTLVLWPTQSGTVKIDTSNGPVRVEIPEGPRYGYDLDAKTSNGRIAIELEDGEVSGEKDEQSFLTHGFDERDVQTVVSIDTSNGGVTVAS